MAQTFITGDTHGEIDYRKLSSKNFMEGRKCTKDDFLIVAGDFGVIWHNDPNNRAERYLTEWYNEKKWTTLFVDGNHENHDRLDQLPIIEKWGGKVGVVSDSIFHLKRGEIYLLNGKTYFCFGGAMSRDTEWRTLGLSWWKQEVASREDTENALNNLEKHNYKVDRIIAHTVPEELVSMLGFFKGKNDPTRSFLDHIVRSTEFDDYYCGHCHMDKSFGKFHVLYHSIVKIT